jgi:hypothetical protein
MLHVPTYMRNEKCIQNLLQNLSEDTTWRHKWKNNIEMDV